MGKLKMKTAKGKKNLPSKKEKDSLNELRRTLGFPENTQFLGYAIYLEESDEFLAEFKDLPKEGITKKVWAKTPQLAACYMTREKAMNVSEECSNSVVVGLFDTGDQIMTITMSANR